MRSSFCFLFAVLLLVACDSKTVKSGFTSLDGAVWERDSIVSFSFSELDSTAVHDLFIHVRNDNTFPFSNLFLIAELGTPSGKVVRDTLEYDMAAPDGAWLGKGYGSIKENKLWYKEEIVFSESGVYTLEISHAMRQNGKVDGVLRLSGITDVGFEIVKK